MTKFQLLLCLTVGNILGGLIYSQTVLSVSLDDVFDAPGHLINSLAAGKSEAQTPLPVPQMQPPIGNAGNQAIQPCAAPPPPMAASPREEMPTSLKSSSSPIRHYSDPKARILMNIAPGNTMSSLLNRVSYPDYFDDKANYWKTENGKIAVTNDPVTDRVTAIWIVQ